MHNILRALVCIWYGTYLECIYAPQCCFSLREVSRHDSGSIFRTLTHICVRARCAKRLSSCFGHTCYFYFRRVIHPGNGTSMRRKRCHTLHAPTRTSYIIRKHTRARAGDFVRWVVRGKTALGWAHIAYIKRVQPALRLVNCVYNMNNVRVAQLCVWVCVRVPVCACELEHRRIKSDDHHIASTCDCRVHSGGGVEGWWWKIKLY